MDWPRLRHNTKDETERFRLKNKVLFLEVGISGTLYLSHFTQGKNPSCVLQMLEVRP